MIYCINKLVGFVFSPLPIAILLGLIGLVIASRRKRVGYVFMCVSVIWLWLWSTPMMYRWFAMPLEREWPVQMVCELPQADAIVVLGGGMGANTNSYPYAEMWCSADRVWHAARIFKAGKASVVIPSGSNEENSTLPLLLDFGVPRDSIVIENEARNTEENAKFIEKIVLMNQVKDGDQKRAKILLVTSAWHMRRSMLMFAKYAPGLDVVPAPADYEATVRTGNGFCIGDLLPSVDALAANSYCFKEYIGYWGYKLFR